MLSGAITNRYTQGLYEAAVANGSVETVERGLLAVASALQSNAELKALIEHPLVDIEAKVGVLQKVFGDTLTETVYNFFRVLFSRDRSAYVAAVAASFHEKVEATRGRVMVSVESAMPMSDEVRTRLEQDLAGALGKQVEATVSVDGRLLAGYRIRIGNRVLDATIRAAIDQFSEQLLAAGASKEGTS
jgi:F-type H+-transporting ATPase subunit delta